MTCDTRYKRASVALPSTRATSAAGQGSDLPLHRGTLACVGALQSGTRPVLYAPLHHCLAARLPRLKPQRHNTPHLQHAVRCTHCAHAAAALFHTHIHTR